MDWGLLKLKNKEKVGPERKEKVGSEVWYAGLQACVSCRGLQMALRIKSKLC